MSLHIFCESRAGFHPFGPRTRYVVNNADGGLLPSSFETSIHIEDGESRPYYQLSDVHME
jgi:hypothetical protein